MTKYVLRKLLKWLLVALCAAALLTLILLLTPEDPASCLLAKPVIYLYPETATEVTVSIGCADALTASIPAYRDGWHISAAPDGTLTDLADGRTYDSLFWEAEKVVDFDFSRGFCVAGADTETFLSGALAQLGLNGREAAAFLAHWVPQLEQNEWNLLAFQADAYTAAAPLTISPAPDSLLRVFLAWKPLSAPVEIAPQTLAPFTREGFTVVEWGGAQVC